MSIDTASDRGFLPPELRQDWPVPRIEVAGKRDSFAARVEARIAIGTLDGLSRLPLGLREIVVGGLARLARLADRSHSNAARAFLRQALGASRSDTEIEHAVLEAWRHFLRVTIESEGFQRHVTAANIRSRYDVKLHPDCERILRDKCGSILVTAHVGDWEAGSAILPWLGFDPLYVIAKPPKNRALALHLQEIRERRGLRCLPRRGAMQHAAAVIRAGGCLAMLLDQRARTKPVLAPFFGRPARCDRSAGVLLRRLGAPVMIAACFRAGTPYHYRAEITTVLWPEDLARANPEAIATRINQELEKLILTAPEQYFWLHDRYRGTELAPGGKVPDESPEPGDDGEE